MSLNRIMDKEMCYIYTMECHSAVKSNAIMKFTGTWMELDKRFLSEVTQTKKAKYVLS